MKESRDVFHAIADPTRRQIIGMLANESLNVTTIAEHFDITRQAVSLHIQFLLDCGLIKVKQQGRERYCEADLRNLDTVVNWVEESRKIWMDRFQSLEEFLEKTRDKKQK